MKNKQKVALLKYLSDFFRTFGGAAVVIGSTYIFFNKQESIEHPAITVAFIVTGFLSLLLGSYFVYIAEHYNDL